MKKWLRNTLFLLTILLSAICALPQTQDVQAATPKISKTKITLAKGAQSKLKVTGTNKKIKWSTDKRKVATVSSKGVVTAKGKGAARITAKVGKKKLVCRVTVETPKINKTRLTLAAGKTATLKINGTKGKPQWYATDTSVATVTQKGVVRGIRAGYCRVYAKVRGKLFLCQVNVTNAPTHRPNNPTVTPGNKFDANQARNSLSYESHRTDQGVVIIVKNNYKFSVDLEANVVYYNASNTMVGTASDFCYVLEPGRDAALRVHNPYNSDYEEVGYSRYAVNFVCKETNAIGNANYIYCGSNFGSGNVMVTARNSGARAEFTVISIVYYKNGSIVGYDYRYADINNPGMTDYIQFNFPYDSEYNTITPDNFRVFVNCSYRYSW